MHAIHEYKPNYSFHPNVFAVFRFFWHSRSVVCANFRILGFFSKTENYWSPLAMNYLEMCLFVFFNSLPFFRVFRHVRKAVFSQHPQEYNVFFRKNEKYWPPLAINYLGMCLFVLFDCLPFSAFFRLLRKCRSGRYLRDYYIFFQKNEKIQASAGHELPRNMFVCLF